MKPAVIINRRWYKETAEPPKLPKQTRSAKAGGPRSLKAAPAKPKPRPDRSALTAAETALTNIDADEKAELAQIAAERERLDAREEDVTDAAGEARRQAKVALERARREFVRQGGQP